MSNMSQNLRTRLLAILDIVLRVPPVFLMDSVLINGLGEVQRIPGSSTLQSLSNSSLGNTWHFSSNITIPHPDNDDEFVPLTGASIGWLIIYIHGEHCLFNGFFSLLNCFLVFIAAFAMFLLSTRHLLTIYVWLASVGVILWSYICNEEFMKFAISIRQSTMAYELISFNFNAIFKFLGNYMLQVVKIFLKLILTILLFLGFLSNHILFRKYFHTEYFA